MRGYRDSDGRAAIGNAVAEGIDRLRLVVTGQSLVIVSAVNADVTLDVLSELFTDLGEHRFFAGSSHHFVGEVGMHARTIPVQLAEGLGVPVNTKAVLLADPLQQVSRYPGFIACALGTFCENLKFPLTSSNLGVNAFHIDARCETQIKVLFYTLPAKGVPRSDRAVIRPLRPGVAVHRKAGRQLSINVPQKILLLETEPEVVIVIVDGSAAVRCVRRAVRVEYFCHHQKSVFAAGVRENRDGL